MNIIIDNANQPLSNTDKINPESRPLIGCDSGNQMILMELFMLQVKIVQTMVVDTILIRAYLSDPRRIASNQLFLSDVASS